MITFLSLLQYDHAHVSFILSGFISVIIILGCTAVCRERQILSVIICTCFIDEKEQANVSSFSLHVLIIGNDRDMGMVRGRQC